MAKEFLAMLKVTVVIVQEWRKGVPECSRPGGGALAVGPRTRFICCLTQTYRCALEIEDVLLYFEVPRGLPLDPGGGGEDNTSLL